MPAAAKKRDPRFLFQDGDGKEILPKGTRSSTGNDGKFPNILNVPEDKRQQAILQTLDSNLKLRAATAHRKNKKGPMHDRLKGLFGGS